MEGSHKLLSAVSFACKAHVDQRRKNKEGAPYVNHPVSVATFLSQAGITDVNVLCAAVLHDTVEDTATSLYTLSNTFGDDVASFINECSDDKSLAKVERKKLQIEHFRGASCEAKCIKLADKLDNLTSLLNDPPLMWSPQVVKGYALWSWAVVSSNTDYHNATFKDACKRLYAQVKDVIEALGVDVTRQPLESELEAYYELIDERVI